MPKLFTVCNAGFIKVIKVHICLVIIAVLVFTDTEEDLDAAVRALQDTAQDIEALVCFSIIHFYQVYL